jgi:hypothetical protein
MAFLLGFGVFVAVVGLLAWYSHRRGQNAAACCAPADPRRDLRMRSAFQDGQDDAPGTVDP